MRSFRIDQRGVSRGTTPNAELDFVIEFWIRLAMVLLADERHRIAGTLLLFSRFTF